MAGPVRVFVACSLDGFIAGRDNDLSWLPPPENGDDYGYDALLAQTSAILMGRGTYDVAAHFAHWPYAETPVFVATTRALEPVVPTVRAISGTPHELLSIVGEDTDGGIYLDGGTLIRSFLDDNAVDELTVTVVNAILGEGIPLFAGATRPHRLKRLIGSTEYQNGLVQPRYTPVESRQSEYARARAWLIRVETVWAMRVSASFLRLARQ